MNNPFSKRDSTRSERSSFLQKSHRRGWVGVLILMLVSTSLISENAALQVSLLTLPQHAAFDGTVYPVQQVPEWKTLGKDNDEVLFGELSSGDLLPAPVYDPERLKIAADSLQWGDPEDDEIRQMKLTYSVAYAGSYEGDGAEGEGSHPAVDIRAPEGTPVYAIANGVVDRVSYGDSGFGNLIVLQHDDFPSPDNPSVHETIYSDYAHLSQIKVQEGQVVRKGEKIGEVGATGTATTNHLHFQMDNAQAPWHPYWPFNSSEANEVGGFFEAINVGLGQSNLYAYTINPLEYVQTYLNMEGVVVETTPEDPAIEVVNETTEIEEEPSVEPQLSPSSNESGLPFDAIDSNHQAVMLPDSRQMVRISLLQSDGRNAVTPSYNGSIVVKSSDLTVLSVFPYELPAFKFSSGPTEIEFEALKEGRSEITFSFLGKEYARYEVVVSSDPAAFVVSSDDSTSPEAFVDLDEEYPYYNAITLLKERGILQGYPDGTVQPGRVVSRVEALKLILEVSSETLISGSTVVFPDTDPAQWYSSYVATAQSKGVVQGYPDGLFRPAQEVNRVEFTKMLLKGLGIDVDPVVLENPYEDVSYLDWYAPYANFIKQSNLSPWIENLQPSEPMTRGEVAEMIYRVLVVQEKSLAAYDSQVAL
ncbi:MAG: hypothetical protein ACD_28C00317G0032 [uncultured bacterium]|nr:MAG: hypothetical protein ACD_28C00317G0032 [uncultured bacterium]KKT77103.1 MAG: Cellulosome-anchoring protein [Candidatus Peregrinibacteria bacterium GW2011_GWA2_44_7]